MPLMDNTKKGFYLAIALILLFTTVVGCSVRLTFRGSSVPDNIRTASVQYFENRAMIINPLLSQTFTEGLKDRITKESRLVIRDGMGDVDFSGEVTGYDLRPMAIQANALSAQTRLTITIKVRYRNYKEPRANWESTFSAYEDFDSAASINVIEGQLVEQIVDQLTENIFNRAFSDW
jgi:hypothetical protein